MQGFVNVSTPQNVVRLNRAIEDRARELGKSFNQVARDAGITTETLSALRGKGKKRDPGSRPYDKTARGIDRALQWPDGTTMAIWDGKEPTAVSSDDADLAQAIAKIEGMTKISREQKDLLIAQMRDARRSALQRARELNEQQRDTA